MNNPKTIKKQKMKHHKPYLTRILILPALILLLSALLVNAQVSAKIYAITLNYKSSVLLERLSLVDIREAQGTPQDFSAITKGYRLDILSADNKLLKSIRFNIPIPELQEGDLNLDFTMGLPYHNNAKQINIYDAGNNKVLEIPLQSSSPTSAKPLQELSQIDKKQNIVWLVVALPLFAVILFLAYIELNRKKSHAELMQHLSKQNALALRNYIMANSRKGYGKDQLRNVLLKNNYTKDEINEAFKGLK
ncbi:MAG: hypothetical protein AABX33_05305 [Nanoarchaeota archaeon]